MAHDGLESSPQAGMNRLIDVENPTAMRVPHKRGWTVDSAIIQEDLRFFPHYVIGGVDRKNNFFFPFTAELYTYMEVNRNDGFFNGLISSTR